MNCSEITRAVRHVSLPSSPLARALAFGCIGSLLAPAALLCAACGGASGQAVTAPAAGTTDRAASAATGTPSEHVVHAAPFEDVFLLTGEMKASRSLDLPTPRSNSWNIQIKWLAEDGADVAEGDRLVEFDNSSIASRIEENRLAYLQSEIQLESRQAALVGENEDRELALDRARSELEKARLKASVPEELSKRKEWQENQAALRRANAAVDKAGAALESFSISSRSELEVLKIARDKAARNIAESEHLLDALSIKASRPGIFIVNENWEEGRRKFQVGDTVWPGITVGSIPDLSQMEVSAWLSDVDDGKIAPGMKTRCILDTYPDRTFAGRIEEVARLADQTGFRVRVSLKEPDGSIMRPGMSVRIEVVRRSWPAALTVPRQALRREGEGTFVALAGRSDPVAVKIASCTPTDCVVDSGVAEGDHVLVR